MSRAPAACWSGLAVVCVAAAIYAVFSTSAVVALSDNIWAAAGGAAFAHGVTSTRVILLVFAVSVAVATTVVTSRALPAGAE